MAICMLSGDEAEARLADPDFERDWNVLHQACPWSTPYQGSPFVRTWLDVYKTKFVPIIIYEYEAGVLVGLLLLARPSDGTRTIAHIGTHHAEYQTWLATAEVSDRFIEGALKMLKAGKLAKSLRFLFLAPGTPIAWTGATSRTGLPTSVRLHRRGRMRLDKVTGHLSPLRKKSNKSRLSRLKKHGTVQLEFLEGSEKLEKELDKIADYCDLRQCAAYGVMPFRADPLKRVFYLALADVDGLLHATVLKVGNDVVAAHLGVADASSVSLGVITHAPQHGSSSPGKLIIYLLVDMLSEQGREWFDLTPGGSYKDRFATEFDDVFVLDVFLSPAAYLQYALRRAAVANVRSLARLATPVTARIERRRVSRNAQSEAVHSVHPRDSSTLSRQISASVDSSGKELVIFRCEFGQTPSMSTSEALNVNRIQDLLDYKKKSREMPDIQKFMMQSSNRLAKSLSLIQTMEIFYTAVGFRMSCWSLITHPPKKQTGIPPFFGMILICGSRIRAVRLTRYCTGSFTLGTACVFRRSLWRQHRPIN